MGKQDVLKMQQKKFLSYNLWYRVKNALQYYSRYGILLKKYI